MPCPIDLQENATEISKPQSSVIIDVDVNLAYFCRNSFFRKVSCMKQNFDKLRQTHIFNANKLKIINEQTLELLHFSFIDVYLSSEKSNYFSMEHCLNIRIASTDPFAKSLKSHETSFSFKINVPANRSVQFLSFAKSKQFRKYSLRTKTNFDQM